MSTRFTVFCETCDEVGPHIRRHHRGAFLLAADSARFFPTVDPDQAVNDWGEFLSNHAYHELALVTEYRRPGPPKPEALPTHRLLADGSLEEIH